MINIVQLFFNEYLVNLWQRNKHLNIPHIATDTTLFERIVNIRDSLILEFK